jgi:curli production assembly/transport component CsgE
MLIRIGLISMIQLFLVAGIASAQSADCRVEIDGLILNQTKTRTGHDFYRQFASVWEPPSDATGLNIVIIENANPQWGSIIVIKVNDSVVFQSLVKPNQAAIRELAAKAADRVREFVSVYLRDLEKYRDDDLATEGW